MTLCKKSIFLAWTYEVYLVTWAWTLYASFTMPTHLLSVCFSNSPSQFLPQGLCVSSLYSWHSFLFRCLFNYLLNYSLLREATSHPTNQTNPSLSMTLFYFHCLHGTYHSWIYFPFHCLFPSPQLEFKLYTIRNPV